MTTRIPSGFQVVKIVTDRLGFGSHEVKVSPASITEPSMRPTHEGESFFDSINDRGFNPPYAPSKVLASLCREYEGRSSPRPAPYNGYVPPKH